MDAGHLNDPLTSLRGIGEKSAASFAAAGIYDIAQLLHYFPRDYRQVPQITRVADVSSDDPCSCIIEGRVMSGATMSRRNGKVVTSCRISDGSGVAQAVFFNLPYIAKQLPPGRTLILYGSAHRYMGELKLVQPRILTVKEYECIHGTLQPIYPLHAGMTEHRLRSAIRAALPLADLIQEYLPEELCKELDLMRVPDAIRTMHQPDCLGSVYRARRRLAFDEFFLFLYQMQALKAGSGRERELSPYPITGAQVKAVDSFLSCLPYALTGAQRSTIDDILRDMGSGYAMNRLVQGDVGSGKTVVAFAAAHAAVGSGAQAAIMAPTEVLAAQHHASLCEMTRAYGLPFVPALLTGSTKAADKRRIKADCAAGRCNVLIGTHALLEEDVAFDHLALVVTDEQHRFGVRQRMTLSDKGVGAHILVMSATPIPRTLGLILYGDLDVSLIDELPSTRKPIKCAIVDENYREKLWKFMLKQVGEGRQCYVICPMVEPGEDMEGADLANVADYAQDLRGRMPPQVRIDALHGRMKPAQKSSVMERFARGETDILVSTTVVEVGVNVPNATVMIVENAERFGLSQLHQLRGRVGRGDAQSYCVFVAGGAKKAASEKTMERLSVLKETNDGFRIAEEDLKQRGPGDFFGLRQSGDPMFRIADIYADATLLQQSKAALERMLIECPKRLDFLKEQASALDYIGFHSICL